jgi:hypothetical protein
MKNNEIYNVETTNKGSIEYNDRRKIEKKKEYYKISRDLYEVMLSDIRRRKGRA